MISIIICSVDQKALQRLRDSIDATVKQPCEIIVYPNTDGKGLCEVYNSCAAKAKGDYLCFVHEDVIFHSARWGEEVIAHLSHKTTGFVGVMGGRYKSLFGVSWNDGPTGMHLYNVKNGALHGQHLLHNPAGRNEGEVICLDGAFLCCTRQTWQSCKFDETTFTGFHFYDLDVCLQANAAGLKNYVIYDVLIEHFSEGKKEKAFLQQYLLFVQKWQHRLPAFTGSISKREMSRFDGYALTETIRLMRHNGFPFRYAWMLIKRYVSLYKNAYQYGRLLYFGRPWKT